jgi:membrane-bound lytic murein transglycosylase B
MIRFWNKLRLIAPACLAVTLLLLLASCSSTSSNDGDLPKNLPHIALSGSSATPPHHLASYEYPFDSSGRYVSEWAAEGERKAGRSGAATSADSERWSGSHGGSASKSKKSSSSSKSKSKSSSKGGRSYTVKKGDTLGAIARRYGTTTKKIMAANGMSSDFLKIGRVLKIP